MESNVRIVKQTTVGELFVSTVFLGIDHGHDTGSPVLFETMVFRDGESEDCWRCCTWEEAEKQHRDACREVMGLVLVVANEK